MNRDPTALIEDVSALLEAPFDARDATDVQELMKQQYMQLRLIDNSGRWAAEGLCNIAEALLPDNMDGEKVKEFIGTIARNVADNRYLCTFLADIMGKSFQNLSKNVRTEGGTVLVEVVAYALMLDRLTKAMRDDWTILEACRQTWQKAIVTTDFGTVMNHFERAKFWTMDRAIQRLVESLKSGKVPPTRGRWAVPLAIIEACVEDLRLGYRDNAHCGWTLARHPPGSRTYNEHTGAGPSGLASDKKAMLQYPPLPKKWADLYTTWNMAFVSHYSNFPFFLAKLLTPQVSCYQDKPEEYMTNRLLSLDIHIWYELFSRVGHLSQERTPIAWADPQLTRIWARNNKESAESYASEIAKLERVS